MPAAVPLIVGAAGSALGWSALATSLATVGSALAVGAYEQKRAKQKARDAYNKSLQDRLVPIRSGVAPRGYVLGTVRTSGPVMYVETVGEDRSAFDIIIAVANNECTLNGWYLNEEFISTTSFPGAKYGLAVPVPMTDQFTVSGPTAQVTLSQIPSERNKVSAVWRKDGASGIATATLFTGAIYNLSGLPSGQSTVTLTYSARQGDYFAAQFQEGAADQAASDWSAFGITSPGWTSAHRLRGIANARALFSWEENLYQSGAPALGVVVTGRAIASHPFYDPRNGSNPSTTKNPAILAGWWMTLPRRLGGCGIPSDWIDWQSIAVAANVCDEQISLKNHTGSGYTTGPRYECNTFLSTDDSPLVNLETILSAMAGRRAFTSGKYRIVAGAFRPATITLTDADVVGDEPITVATGSNEDSPPNIVTATIADDRANWLEVEPKAVKNDTYIASDGAEHPLDILLPATTDARRANYLMGIALEGSRPAMTCQVTVGGVGENLAVFDTLQLSLTNRDAYAGRTFEIVAIEDHWDGTFTLTLAEIRPQTWALDPDSYTPIDPVELPDISYLWNPPDISGFEVAAITPQLLPDGTSVSRIELEWDPVPPQGNSPNARVELRYRVTGGDWIGIASVPGDATASTLTAALIDGEVYQFQARFVNGVGAASAWVDALTKIEGTPLPTPLSMRLRASSTIFRVPQSGNALPVSITFDVARTGGLVEAAVFTTSPGGITLGGSGDTRTLAYSAMGSNETVQVTCTITQNSVDYVDSLTILKVFDGVDADTTPDLTAPPTPSGLNVTSFLVHLLVSWTAPNYTQGHGHEATIVYAAPAPVGSPLPVFSAATAVGSSQGNTFSFPAAPGTRWAIWIKFQTRDGIQSTTPAGGTNGVLGTTAQIGNANLGPLVVEAANLANGAVTAAKLQSGAIDATKFASSIQPVSIVSSLPSPSGYTGPRVVFNTSDGKLHRYTGSAWTDDIAASDITGQLTNDQIAAIAAAKLTGQITSTQITDGAISTPKLAAGSVSANNIQTGAVLAEKIASGAITTPKLAAAAVTANELAANSVIAGKIAAGAVSAAEIAAGAITASKIAVTSQGAALNADPACMDQSAWQLLTALGSVTANTASSIAPGGRVLRITDAARVRQRPFVPVVQGKRYRISCWARQVQGTGTFYLRFIQRDPSETIVSGGTFSAVTAQTLTSSFQRFSGVVDALPNAIYGDIDFLCSQGGTSTSIVDIADPRVEEVIPGELIVDGAITARKLFITSSGGALNDDPDTTDFTAWNYQDSRFTIAANTDTPGITTVIRSTPGIGSVQPISRPIAFNPNKTYRVRCRARNGGANGTFYLFVDLKDSAGTRIGGDGTYWFYAAPGVTVPSSFTQYEGRFGLGTSKPFPSNARTMAVGAIMNYQGTAGWHTVTNLLIEECVDSGLIVDGAIQATHLAANSIAVGTAAIQNGAIVNAMIANAAIDSAKILNLQVDKLTSGTLGAEINVGAGKVIFDNGTVMRVQGTGFGTANQFIDWFGLRPLNGNYQLCSEANARFYLKANGESYFGGALAPDALKNGAQTTNTLADASVTIGPFTTLGANKSVEVTYSFNRHYAWTNNQGSVNGTAPTASILLEKSVNGGSSWTPVTTLNVSGNVVFGPNAPDSFADVIMSGSTTVTDTQGPTNNLAFRARITARTLPSTSGSFTSTTTTQTVGVQSTEVPV